MYVWATWRPRSYWRHRNLCLALCRLNCFWLPVVASTQSFNTTIRSASSAPVIGWALTAFMLLLASRTWLLLYSAFANGLPFREHLVVQTVNWLQLVLRARRNYCRAQVGPGWDCVGGGGGWSCGVCVLRQCRVLGPRDPAACKACATLRSWRLPRRRYG